MFHCFNKLSHYFIMYLLDLLIIDQLFLGSINALNFTNNLTPSIVNKHDFQNITICYIYML